ncbi:MAG: hypothetical protein JO024_09390 [Candidatus Eremiobacteraeota bacterium]|nr:hypothetical protein [Candidatus Eremiobacteraeota bacterium]MBV9737994.1 hypothetical protein [Candidatus Eremiobacteraeota bacterium]
MYFKPLLVSGLLATALIAGAATSQTSPAIAQTIAATPNPYLRGERGSARNIYRVRIRLERLIDQLNNDQHDYGGHRVQAIQFMQQARQQLLLAEQWDLQHPGSSPIR